MTASEISNNVNNGYDPSELTHQDHLGHIGILIAHAYLHGIPAESEIMSRYIKIDIKSVDIVLRRMSSAGLLTGYGWLSKSRGAMLRMPPKKAEACILAWTHIAAIASGYVEPLPNQHYTAGSEIYKIIHS
jgi:hypothetical protein